MSLSIIKVLIVEDELITALDIKLSLFKSGYNVIGIARNEDEVKKIMEKDKLTPFKQNSLQTFHSAKFFNAIYLRSPVSN